MKEIPAVTVCPFWRRQMMRTRRSLFVFGALLAVGVLLAPQSAFAQQVSAVMVEDVTSSTIELEWTGPTSPVDEIHVGWVKENEDGDADIAVNPPPAMITRDIDPSVTTYIITGLEAETEYVVGVRTQVTGSAPTAWVEPSANPTTDDAPTAADRLGPPEGIDTEPGDERVTLSWDAVTGATGYMIEWRTAGQTHGPSRSWSFTPTTNINRITASVIDLENGTEYMFQVSTENASGYGMASEEVKATPVDPTTAVPLSAYGNGLGTLCAGMIGIVKRPIKHRRNQARGSQ